MQGYIFNQFCTLVSACYTEVWMNQDTV